VKLNSKTALLSASFVN